MATAGLAQNPVITFAQGNGQLSWTTRSTAARSTAWSGRRRRADRGILHPPAHQRYRGTFLLVFTVMVPMFYRVVMVTNELPQGMVWIDGGDAVLGDTEGWGIQARTRSTPTSLAVSGCKKLVNLFFSQPIFTDFPIIIPSSNNNLFLLGNIFGSGYPTLKAALNCISVSNHIFY